MKHPSEATLALYAGGDLHALGRWRTEHHLAGCESCRLVVEEFGALRGAMGELRDMPEIAWNRVAAEMKANIRLGLEAGECVRNAEPDSVPGQPVFPGWRALVACVSMVALVTAGFLLERTTPQNAASVEGTVLRATANGIELRQGEQTLTLLHGRTQEVLYSAGAGGSMRARYVDADTGYVTINNVYGQ